MYIPHEGSKHLSPDCLLQRLCDQKITRPAEAMKLALYYVLSSSHLKHEDFLFLGSPVGRPRPLVRSLRHYQSNQQTDSTRKKQTTALFMFLVRVIATRWR